MEENLRNSLDVYTMDYKFIAIAYTGISLWRDVKHSTL